MNIFFTFIFPILLIALMAVTSFTAGYYRCITTFLSKARDAEDPAVIMAALIVHSQTVLDPPLPVRFMTYIFVGIDRASGYLLNKLLRPTFSHCKELLRIVKKRKVL